MRLDFYEGQRCMVRVMCRAEFTDRKRIKDLLGFNKTMANCVCCYVHVLGIN